jgi:hypothetical protein
MSSDHAITPTRPLIASPPPLRRVFLPHLNAFAVLGRREPRVVHPHLQLKSFYRGDIAIPSIVDYRPKALTGLRNPHLNLKLGCCVIAGGWHVREVWTGNATGVPIVGTDAQIVADYSAIGGYVPGDESTDQGCDMQTAIARWMGKGFASDPASRVAMYLGIDPSDQTLLKTALYCFEHLYMGFGLPEEWISPFPSKDGYLWDVAGPSVSTNGHCVMAAAFDSQGIGDDSWGLEGTITWPALAKYGDPAVGGEVYVMLSAESLDRARQRAPNGFDWDQLLAAFQAIGGELPAGPIPGPSPAPTPAPSPKPASTPTLAQAQAWAAKGLADSWPKA